MVVTNDFGKSAWALKLGTAAPGTNTEAGADFDSGNALYLLARAEDLAVAYEGLDKIYTTASGYNYAIRSGKRGFSVAGTALVVEGEETGHEADVVHNINHVISWVATKQVAAGSAYYLIVRINGHSVIFYQQTTARYYLGVLCPLLQFAGIHFGHARLRFRFVEAWT